MKKLLTIATVMSVIVSGAFAQLGLRSPGWSPDKKDVHTNSVNVTSGTNSLSVLFLRDGLSNDYTALAYPLAQVTGLPARVNIVGLGAYNSKFSTANTYVGTGLQVVAYQNKGWQLSVYGGLKGFDVKTFNFTSGSQGWVFGAGLTIPVGN